MKTTLEIPDQVYKQAKIPAVELGTSLKEILLRGLERELASTKTATAGKSYWAERQLLPEYAAALKSGAFSGGSDSTQIISEERDAR